MKIAVVGSGAWGTALAVHLCKNGHEVTLWSHNPEKAAAMTSSRMNPTLPGTVLPPEMTCSGDPACVQGQALVVLASPSFPFRTVCQTVAPYLDRQSLLVSVTKGIEPETLLRMSQVAVRSQPCRGSGPGDSHRLCSRLWRPGGCGVGSGCVYV